MSLETVTFLRRDLQGNETTYEDVVALQTAVDVGTESAGDGAALTVESCTWHVQASTLAVRPRRGDRIEGADGTWEVLSAGKATLATRYPCRCVKVA